MSLLVGYTEFYTGTPHSPAREGTAPAGGHVLTCGANQSCDGLVLDVEALDSRSRPPTTHPRLRAHQYEAPWEPDSPCAALLDTKTLAIECSQGSLN